MKHTKLMTSIFALGLATAITGCSKPDAPADDVVVVEPVVTEEPAATMPAETAAMEADTAAMEADTAALEADTAETQADMIANDGEMPVEATTDAPAEMN